MPVIARELRSAARQSNTYWLRVGGGAAALFTIVAGALDALQGNDASAGARVFSLVHRTVFFSILLGVPWLVGDCLSRERREGTLGLLFLTPLRPYEIVLSKLFVHGIRALTLWLAVLPVMALAFFKGGVSWRDAVLSAVVNLSTVLLALGVGLLASAYSKRWLRAMITATCGSILAALVLMIACGGKLPLFSWTSTWAMPRMIGGLQVRGAPMAVFASSGNMMVTGRPWMPTLTTSLLSVSPNQVLQSSLVAMLGLAFAILVAARRVSRSWREEPPPQWVIQLHDLFCVPRYGKQWLARWMKWQIERNPIGWLERRTWSGRLVIWGWFATIVSLYSGVFSSPGLYMHAFGAIQTILAALLLLFVGWSAAGSFQRERETGVLELLLVSPVKESRIIGGRLRGIWSQFLPALVTLMLIWLAFPRIFSSSDPGASLVFVFSSYLALPIIGLYQSLQRHHFISAFLWTLAWAILVPLLLASIALLLFAFLSQLALRTGLARNDLIAARLILATLLQWVIAGICGFFLHHNLARRKFALERTSG